jgi:hypothetical protein
MDRITKSFLDEFVSEYSLEALPEDRAFEHFCGWLITSQYHSETFSTDDITVGSGGDSGIDCISILVNGSLVTDADEVAELEQANGYIDATFVFVQAERSSSFDTAKIGQFAFGVRDFLSEQPTLVQNTSVKEASRIVAAVSPGAPASGVATRNACCGM